MRIIKEDIKNPDVIEVGIVYNGEYGESIKVNKISIDISSGLRKPGFIIDYSWKLPTGKTGRKRNADISEILQYFKDWF